VFGLLEASSMCVVFVHFALESLFCTILTFWAS
jgi:hypothetical protein